MAADHEITRLLQAWGKGDGDALDELLPLVFQDLHRMAHYFFRRESKPHTLQPTALISELYFRLRGKQNMEWSNRTEFFHFAAELMRHVLVDHARSKKALKRGAGIPDLDLEAAFDLSVETDIDLIALDQALEELEKIDERQSRIVALRFFAGLTVPEISEVLKISPATIKREWRTAKFWLHRRLKP